MQIDDQQQDFMLPAIEDTIVALATPPGRGALAIVRLSGPDAIGIADRIANKPVSGRGSRIRFRRLVDGNGVETDQAVVLLYKQPHSYTGQDVVELSLHGSPVIVKQVINRCVELGARVAEPGEFTFRAFWNGKLTLEQAEGVANLIAASDHNQQRLAIRILDGEFGQQVRQLQAAITDVAAKLELMLDFSEEDVPLFSFTELLNGISAIITNLKHHLKLSQQRISSSDGLRVALAGPPNAGKSMLLNRLLASDKAIVSHVPGTTRDVVEGELEIAGRRVRFYDTAGLRTTGDEIEREGVRRSRAVHRDADLVLWLHSADRTWGELDVLPERKDRWWLVVNKIDLLSGSPRKVVRSHLHIHPEKIKYLSAKTGKGITEMRNSLEAWVKESESATSDSAAIPFTQRHRQIYRETISSLDEARKSLKRGESPEIVAYTLRIANSKLGELLGVKVTEQTLQHIFAGFCIGK